MTIAKIIPKAALWKASLFSAALFSQSAFCDNANLSEEEQQNALSQVKVEAENNAANQPTPLSQMKIAAEDDTTDQQTMSPQETGAAAAQTPAWNSLLQVGGNYTYVTFNPNGHQTFKGSLGGAQAMYEYRPMNRFYGGLTFAWREGKTHAPTGERSLLYYDVQERAGYTFAPDSQDWRFTLFTGFAYRYVGHNLRPKGGGSSIRFGYNEFYFPVGFLSDYEAFSWASVGVNFTWMPQVFSAVSIVPLKGNHWDLTDQLNNYCVELPVTFNMTDSKRFLLILKPSYQRWQDGHSYARTATGLTLGLPRNTYNYYGVDLNFAFSF